jgi:glucose-6-phosphate 1-epimerase
MELEVTTPATPFSFTAALHTYLKVREVEALRIEGLRGLDYRLGRRRQDQEGNRRRRDHRRRDRPHLPRPAHPAGPRRSPGDGHPRRELSRRGDLEPLGRQVRQLADMPADGFRRMLCVEPPPCVSPSNWLPAPWWGRQTLVAM